MKATAVIVGILVLFLGFGWLIMGNDFFMFKVFAPRVEQVRREVFEQSKAYKQGVIQELQNMQFEYIQASPEHKEALASLILHRAADFDENKLPSDLREFIAQLRREQSAEKSY